MHGRMVFVRWDMGGGSGVVLLATASEVELVLACCSEKLDGLLMHPYLNGFCFGPKRGQGLGTPNYRFVALSCSPKTRHSISQK